MLGMDTRSTVHSPRSVDVGKGESRLLARGRSLRLPGACAPVASWNERSGFDRTSHSGGAAPESHRLPYGSFGVRRTLRRRGRMRANEIHRKGKPLDEPLPPARIRSSTPHYRDVKNYGEVKNTLSLGRFAAISSRAPNRLAVMSFPSWPTIIQPKLLAGLDRHPRTSLVRVDEDHT